jgi:excisionase family DNA binding protein
MEDELLTVEQVATRLKLSTATVRRLLARGEIRGRKVGERQWRVLADALKVYIEGEPNAGADRMDTSFLPNRSPVRNVEIRSKKVAKMLETAGKAQEGNRYAGMKKPAKAEQHLSGRMESKDKGAAEGE